MNYFPFHIGDYAVHTRHLTLMEDLAYRRMIDLYYTRESVLPGDAGNVARLIGMRDNVTEVSAVLSEFFALTPEGWAHKRCDAEISKAKDAAERARANGKKGGRPLGSSKEPTTNPEITQPVSSGIPEITNSQAPNPKTNTKTKEKTSPPGSSRFAEFWMAWPKTARKEARGKCEDMWRKRGLDSKADLILSHVKARASSHDWQKESGQFVPAPIVYLNNEKWDGAEVEAESTFAGGV